MAFRTPVHRLFFILAMVLMLFAMGLGARHVRGAEAVLMLAVGMLMVAWAAQWSRTARPSTRPLVTTLRLLAGDCEIIPRPDSTAQELKRLGNALAQWWDSEEKGRPGGRQWIDQSALNDLLAGELPQPFALRLLGELNSLSEKGGKSETAAMPRPSARELSAALQRARQVYPQMGRLIPPAESRSVHIFLGNRTGLERDRLIESLRRALPADLVLDVLLGGRSWDESD